LTLVAFVAKFYGSNYEEKMCWGINLRADLAKLTDSDLAVEFNNMLEYRSARFGTAPAVGSLRGFFRYGFAWWPGGRGPIRARWAYRARIGYFGPFRGPMGTQYLVECEIKDLRDEMQRRVQTRKSPSSGPRPVTPD
jgi:hypothetical protein